MRIAITGGKGGTGKSMVAVALAREFVRHKKTLLVDADAECPNDHLLLGAKLKRAVIVKQAIPRWNFKKCVKCGACAAACQKNAIVFVSGKYPAFVKDACIGCQACIQVCAYNAITEDKKEIGRIYIGRNYGVNLISGELKLGELASGEVVAEVRKYAEAANRNLRAGIILIDSAAGVGCPVIASLVGTDYIVAVTEPTPSALHDLKRVLYLAGHFKIKHGIVINKFDLIRLRLSARSLIGKIFWKPRSK
ncbi:MAG: 4Fe-4S binding protein [Planctomycetes bacterium]|nr:4Fe-4S binding protein [Planctomycetota bacterium]